MCTNKKGNKGEWKNLRSSEREIDKGEEKFKDYVDLRYVDYILRCFPIFYWSIDSRHLSLFFITAIAI